MALRALLEVIALSAADAEAAQAGGADRLELVSSIADDGLTPDPATVRAVRAATDLPVRVMLRAGAGFAVGDVTALRKDAAQLRAAGAQEFVLGFLTPAGYVDETALAALLPELDGCPWTFHRAIDYSADAATTWAVAAKLGCDTVLAAGARAGVPSGRETLRALSARQIPDTVTLLVGGGLRAQDIESLRADGMRAFHVGSAVRSAGWDSPIDPDAVRAFADLVHR